MPQVLHKLHRLHPTGPKCCKYCTESTTQCPNAANSVHNLQKVNHVGLLADKCITCFCLPGTQPAQRWTSFSKCVAGISSKLHISPHALLIPTENRFNGKNEPPQTVPRGFALAWPWLASHQEPKGHPNPAQNLVQTGPVGYAAPRKPMGLPWAPWGPHGLIGGLRDGLKGKLD